MSFYIKLSTNEYPRHQGDIILEHPELADNFVCPDTYALVEWTDPPEHDKVTQRIEQTTPVLTNGIWKMSWIVRAATEWELEQTRLAKSAA